MGEAGNCAAAGAASEALSQLSPTPADVVLDLGGFDWLGQQGRRVLRPECMMQADRRTMERKIRRLSDCLPKDNLVFFFCPHFVCQTIVAVVACGWQQQASASLGCRRSSAGTAC